MKKIIITVALFIGLFGSSVYAEGPSIEATQVFISEMVENTQKRHIIGNTYEDSIKLVFSGKCQGKLLYEFGGNYSEYKEGYFNLIDDHYFFHEHENYFSIKGRDGLSNIKVLSVRTSGKRKGKKVYSNRERFSVPIIFNSEVFETKIEKAIKHLNAKCQKLSTKKKELF